uniref:cytochrome P450 4C1-like n=1 Tax=Leptopilina boulardi TaxID=63433 RepID=UPI003B5ACDA8
MFVLLLIVTICLGFYHYYTRYGRIGRELIKLHGPFIFPFIGNLHLFFGTPKELWHLTRWINKTYSPINRIWLVHYPAVNLFHPDDAEILLSSMRHIEKSRIYNFLHLWLKTGLLTSTGKKWQHRRKMLTPAFHFRVLEQFLDIFIEEGNKLVENLKLSTNENIHDIVPLFTKHTLNAICETAMGTSLNEADMQNVYRSALNNIIEVIIHRLFRPWLFDDFIFKLVPSGRTFMKYLPILHNFSHKIIEERKEYHEQTKNRYLKSIISEDKPLIPLIDETKGNKKRMAMLDHLIAAQKFGKQINDEGIREEVDTFIFEGHDTTAMAFCFSMLMLAEHKECQDQARKEVDQVLNNERNGKLCMADVQRLTYLEQCIKETLRLYPSVPFISRKINEDLQLKNVNIPAGCSAHLHIFDLHRNPDFWPEPNKFNPERFLPEEINKRHPFSYIPFSGGPRNCIGQKFAMLELKVILAYLLHNFIFEAIDHSKDVIFTSDLVLRPDMPVRVKFITRKK